MGDPGFYARLGFENVPGLIYPGVPGQYVMAACFRGKAPHGEILVHEAFGITHE